RWIFLKKSTSSRGSDFPRGHKVAGAGHGMFLSLHMPGARQAPELALLSATVRASMAGEAAGCGRGDQRALGGKAGVLRLPADPCLAQAPRSGLRSHDGVANHAPAWDGQKGRLAIMIDCADRMVLAWRFAKRITAEDLAEMLREAVFRRFGEARTRAQGIEFLSDNGPEYTSHRFRPFVRA